MKKLLLFLLCMMLLSCCGQRVEGERDPDRLHVVTTVFPAYDFARAVVGDLADVTLLLPPGTESHSYEPTPANILDVQSCDLFLYLGGESDSWVETILTAVEPEGETMRMVDCVPLLEEVHAEGMQMQPGHDHEHGHDESCEEEHEHLHHEGEAEDHEEPEPHGHESVHNLGAVTGMDEHVWTSPKNAAAITRAVGEQLAELDEANAAVYLANAEEYAENIDALDAEFEAFFQSRDDRTIVFGDRFPLLYFADAYHLDYYAAFPGCGTQTEPSAATIAFLTEKVEHEGISTVWYIEFSNHLVTDSIAEATETQTAMFHTCHNVSKQDVESGVTYLSLMTQNLETLKNYL